MNEAKAKKLIKRLIREEKEKKTDIIKVQVDLNGFDDISVIEKSGYIYVIWLKVKKMTDQNGTSFILDFREVKFDSKLTSGEIVKQIKYHE